MDFFYQSPLLCDGTKMTLLMAINGYGRGKKINKKNMKIKEEKHTKKWGKILPQESPPLR